MMMFVIYVFERKQALAAGRIPTFVRAAATVRLQSDGV